MHVTSINYKFYSISLTVEDNIKDDGQGLEKVKVKTLDEIKQDKQDLDNIKVKTLDEIKQEKQAQTKGIYS